MLEIQWEELSSISDGLLKSGIVLEYALIRPFLVTMVTRMRDLSKGVDAEEVYAYVKLACGDGGRTNVSTTATDNQFLLFLTATIERLSAMRNYGEEYMDAATRSLGGESSGLGLEQIFERLAVTPDMESTKQCMKEACRYLVSEMAYRDEGIVKHLGELIAALKELCDNLQKEM